MQKNIYIIIINVISQLVKYSFCPTHLGCLTLIETGKRFEMCTKIVID